METRKISMLWAIVSLSICAGCETGLSSSGFVRSDNSQRNPHSMVVEEPEEVDQTVEKMVDMIVKYHRCTIAVGGMGWQEALLIPSEVTDLYNSNPKRTIDRLTHHVKNGTLKDAVSAGSLVIGLQGDLYTAATICRYSSGSTLDELRKSRNEIKVRTRILYLIENPE